MDETQNTPEETVVETSPVSENQTTQEQPVETTGESTGEQDLAQQAMSEVQSERGQNRVQELANRARVAEMELEQLRAVQQQQMYQPQVYAQPDPYLATRMARIEESLLYNEAEKAYPELDRSSKQYNKDFDDLVYNTYKNEGITPKEAAAKVAKLTRLAQSRAEAQLNETNAQKAAISTGSQRRSTGSYDDSGVKAARDTFKKSGSTDDLARILAGRL